jgi:hypothetical protein
MSARSASRHSSDSDDSEDDDDMELDLSEKQQKAAEIAALLAAARLKKQRKQRSNASGSSKHSTDNDRSRTRIERAPRHQVADGPETFKMPRTVHPMPRRIVKQRSCFSNTCLKPLAPSRLRKASFQIYPILRIRLMKF